MVTYIIPRETTGILLVVISLTMEHIVPRRFKMAKFNYTQEEILETLQRFESKAKELEVSNPESLLSAAMWGVRCVDLHSPETDVEIAYQMVSAIIQEFCSKGYLPEEDTSCVFFSKDMVVMGMASDPEAVQQVVGLYNNLKAM